WLKAGCICCDERGDSRVERVVGVRSSCGPTLILFTPEQGFDLALQARVAGAGSIQERRPVGLMPFMRGAIQLRDQLPTIGHQEAILPREPSRMRRFCGSS